MKTLPTRHAPTINKRIAWIDVSKGIATLLVIIGHTVSSQSPLRKLIFSFHMPLFFILSGYTFHPRDRKTMVISSVKRLLVPYALVYLIWWGPSILQSETAFTFSAIANNVMMFLFASGTVVSPFGYDAVGMTWFLASLFCARIIFNELMLVFNKTNTDQIIQGLVFTLIATVGILTGGYLKIYLPFSLDISLIATLLMWCGYIFRELKLDRYLQSPLFCFTSIIVWLFSAHFSNLELAARLYECVPLAFLGALFGTFSTCSIAYYLCKSAAASPLGLLKRFLNFCGINGMALYCLHSIDWWIPWTSLAALQNFPLANGFISLVRISYNSALTYLLKRCV